MTATLDGKVAIITGVGRGLGRAMTLGSVLIAPEVMVPPLLWLCSNDSDGVSGQRFIGMRRDTKLPPADAAKAAGAPMAWQQLGRQSIIPE